MATALVLVVLVAGVLLRHVGHVAAAYGTPEELRRALVTGGVPCSSPVPGPAATLRCDNPAGSLTLTVFPSERARRASAHSGVEGANWRVTAPTPALARAVAAALNGTVYEPLVETTR